VVGVWILSGTTHCKPEVTLVISDVVVKEFHKCPFSVEIGEKFTATKKEEITEMPLKQCLFGAHRSPKLNIAHSVTQD